MPLIAVYRGPCHTVTVSHSLYSAMHDLHRWSSDERCAMNRHAQLHMRPPRAVSVCVLPTVKEYCTNEVCRIYCNFSNQSSKIEFTILAWCQCRRLQPHHGRQRFAFMFTSLTVSVNQGELILAILPAGLGLRYSLPHLFPFCILPIIQMVLVSALLSPTPSPFPSHSQSSPSAPISYPPVSFPAPFSSFPPIAGTRKFLLDIFGNLMCLSPCIWVLKHFGH